MKLAPLCIALVLVSAPALAGTIRAHDAASHIGETATVEGVVSDVVTSSSGTTFIDMDGVYPHNQMAAVIFAEDRERVGDLSHLEGKKVGLTGKVRKYHGRPEIIVHARWQISPR
jgi:exonuclease VII large subunit